MNKNEQEQRGGADSSKKTSCLMATWLKANMPVSMAKHRTRSHTVLERITDTLRERFFNAANWGRLSRRKAHEFARREEHGRTVLEKREQRWTKLCTEDFSAVFSRACD